MSGAGSKKRLSEAPTIHPEATVTDCDLGVWTEVGKGTVMKDVQMGDYSYITQHCHVVWTTIGKSEASRLIVISSCCGANTCFSIVIRTL